MLKKKDMYSQKVHEIFKIHTRLTFSQFQSCYKCKCNSSEVKSNASKMCALMQKSMLRFSRNRLLSVYKSYDDGYILIESDFLEDESLSNLQANICVRKI